MGTVLGGLISGTCAAVWTRIRHPERVVMVGSTAMLMGMILVRHSCPPPVGPNTLIHYTTACLLVSYVAHVGLAMVVVESAVTSIYICYAEDPSLISRWDAAFFAQISEKLHQRLQHRSARAREVMTNRIDDEVQEAVLA